jgi:ATP-dependent phosphofructokinase / diphosphate-dependent phosphofructokinase
MAKKIAILTAGGDCPGLNAAIRGVAKTAIVEYGMEVIGISDGFRGLVNGSYRMLEERELSGILTMGGTILGTSRDKPFKKDKLTDQDKSEELLENYTKMGLDALVCIGGNGTMKTSAKIASLGVNVIGIPKTIDNDVWGTDSTFGFDSAVSIATDAIDRLHTTGNSHKRIMVIEVMGHHTGWIALHSGIAGGGDIILLPEIPYTEEKLVEHILRRQQMGKEYSIVVVAEGIVKPKKHSAGSHIAEIIMNGTGIETRETVLGYIQRGGTPTPVDRVLATRYGGFAASLIAEGNFGNMVALQNNRCVPIPLADTAGKIKFVADDDGLVMKARKLGVSFGN